MRGKELLETYPKAAEVINEFYRTKMMDSMDASDVPDDFKDMLKQQEFDNEYVAKFIDANPRILFDVFDKHRILIHISIMDDGKEVTFSHHISKAVNSVYAPCITRMEAERNAIEEAFEILNSKL